MIYVSSKILLHIDMNISILYLHRYNQKNPREKNLQNLIFESHPFVWHATSYNNNLSSLIEILKIL